MLGKQGATTHLRLREQPRRRADICEDKAMNKLKGEPLGFVLYRVLAALRIEVTAVLTPLNLTIPQYICLHVLGTDPGQSNAELSRVADVSPQAMNTVVQSLEATGLVERPAAVKSGRARPAELTGCGTALLNRAESAVRSVENRFLANLNERQQKEFRRSLAALATLSVSLPPFGGHRVRRLVPSE